MGSPLSGSLSNIFVHLMEKVVITKFMKEKTIVSWVRYADDVLCICRKDSVNTILTKINGWDKKLNFTVEKLSNNQIKFLDLNVFLENDTIKFRKIFKKGLDTIFTNFKLSVSPYKYKVNNIFTQLHRTRDCCSDEEQFSMALDELREIFARNSYPHKLISEKISTFLLNDEKPPRAENIHTFTLDYNSHRVDTYAKNLVKKIKKFTPDFLVNTSFRSIKISNIYSYTFKPKIDKFDTANCVYHFRCACNLDYYGQCKRQLKVRIREHQQPSRKQAICLHISKCETYKRQYKFFRQPNNDPNITVSQLEIEKYNSQLSNEKLLFEYFKSHFKIVQKNFRSKRHRMAAEAFYIRMNQPKLNEQKEQELFQLFGK